MSEAFKTVYGVRQSRILFPLFFNVYMNEISEKSNGKTIASSLKRMSFNHFIYAEDIVLFCPSAKVLQELINCCVIFTHMLISTKYTVILCRA